MDGQTWGKLKRIITVVFENLLSKHFFKVRFCCSVTKYNASETSICYTAVLSVVMQRFGEERSVTTLKTTM